MKKFIEEFKAFALKGNVLDLAVGVIIGGAFQAIINSVVNDLITPLLGIFLNGVDFANLYIPLKRTVEVSGTDVPTSSYTLAELETMGIGVFKYGSFINAVINFLIMALVIFLMIKGINKLTSLKKTAEVEEAPVAPTTKKCPYCMSEIDISATRCPHCTSELEKSGKSKK